MEIFPQFYGRPFIRISPITGEKAHGIVMSITPMYSYKNKSGTTFTGLDSFDKEVIEQYEYWNFYQVSFYVRSTSGISYPLSECWIDFGDDYMANAMARSIFKINSNV